MSAPFRLRTILVPMDFSPAAQRALEVARELGKSAGPAHLILVHAYFAPLEMQALGIDGPNKVLAAIEAKASDDLEKLLTGLQDAGISAEYAVLQGAPDHVISKLARDKHVDMIVMGTRGRGGVAHALLGSVAERVLRTAPCAVMTVKPG